MPKKKYIVEFSDAERCELRKITKGGVSPARTILRANILLMLDANSGKKYSLKEIASALGTTTTTVQNVKASYCERGLEATLKRKHREDPPVPTKITGDVEAKIIAMRCTDPPEGHARWTLRLLADKAVEIEIIDAISYVSVGNILKKKTNSSRT
jgi:transposase